MDREGKVLSSRLKRSCGFPELDREAVALPKHASPLPKPPDDKPGDTLDWWCPSNSCSGRADAAGCDHPTPRKAGAAPPLRRGAAGCPAASG
ncbi:energy transducer TonB [Sphingomonas fennica]|uniref:energy transducer TonB n=1 Tax=Edaphosphingomonas fennica TaxID=114404 RepID=UPI001FEA92B2|nr:TonB family protein [Sphingomonas fennica]